jgi:hypothetical protein
LRAAAPNRWHQSGSSPAIYAEAPQQRNFIADVLAEEKHRVRLQRVTSGGGG